MYITKDEGQRITKSKKLRVVVHGGKKTIIPYFNTNPFDECFGENFLGTQISIYLKDNKIEDKMEVYSNTVNLAENEKKLYRFLPINQSSDDARAIESLLLRIENRMCYLAGLAFLSLFPGTRLAVFDERMTTQNRIAWIKHERVREFTNEKMDYIGDIDRDFYNALKVLWFHYPYKITKDDEHIKKVSLEEMKY